MYWFKISISIAFVCLSEAVSVWLFLPLFVCHSVCSLPLSLSFSLSPSLSLCLCLCLLLSQPLTLPLPLPVCLSLSCLSGNHTHIISYHFLTILLDRTQRSSINRSPSLLISRAALCKSSDNVRNNETDNAVTYLQLITVTRRRRPNQQALSSAG